MITLNDFSKLDLRIGKIIAAERLEGTEKLLRLEVDIGGEDGEWRQIVAGIGLRYGPEELIGREIVVVANLEPKIIRGIESQGMLLAADSPEGPVILIPEKEVPAGTRVK